MIPIKIQKLIDELEENKINLRQLYIDSLNELSALINKYRILLVISLFVNIVLIIFILILLQNISA